MGNTFQKSPVRAAEFFAGIGLMRMALEQSGVRVVFANDIDTTKARLYTDNFGSDHLVVEDIARLASGDLPDIDIATASFPCTDLSLAGNRAGLAGSESGTFWEFARLLDQLGERRPRAILLENVGGLGSSRGGDDLRAAIERLNGLGYTCDLLMLDARRWVPQSRPRVFIVGSLEPLPGAHDWSPSDHRPAWIAKFRDRHPTLSLQAFGLALPPVAPSTLAEVVERLPDDDVRWWDAGRVASFLESLSPVQASRLDGLRALGMATYRTAYRRTRQGKPVWEIRADDISGCLRTARGGSSRQALVEVTGPSLRARWMTPLEYARLMGAPDFRLNSVRPNQALFGMGDAVCVPAVRWLINEYVAPLAERKLKREFRASVEAGRVCT